MREELLGVMSTPALLALDLYLVRHYCCANGRFGHIFRNNVRAGHRDRSFAPSFIQKFGWVERNDGTIGDTTLLPIHLTFVELTLGKFTDGVGVLLASVLRFRTNCFGGCAGI